MTKCSVIKNGEGITLEALSRREREKLKRRKEILTAARKVFATKEYDSATMDDIAAEAELSKGAIYLYFQNKADLFLSTFEMGMEELYTLTQNVLKDNSGDYLKGIENFIKLQIDFCEENMDMFHIISSEKAHFEIHSGKPECMVFKQRVMQSVQKIISELSSYISEGIKKGVFKEVDPEDAAYVLLSAVHGLAVRAVSEQKSSRIKDKTNTILTIFISGLKK